MIHWGINALNHGSSLAVFENNRLIDWRVNKKTDLLDAGQLEGLPKPDRVFWYERPWLKKARQMYAGQYTDALDMSVVPSRYLKNIISAKITYTPHHASHASAGYYTSGFRDSAVIVLDAIGEFESASIWYGSGKGLKKMWSCSYPNSLGLFYSSFTKLIGFKPILEEHLLQALSAEGDSDLFYDTVNSYFKSPMTLRENLHKGVCSWFDEPSESDRKHIAAAVQRVFEQQVDYVMELAKQLTGSSNLVYMGGCAMNSAYNKKLPDRWKKIWSLPDPSDASSSIGAVLWHSQEHQEWQGDMAKHIAIIR